jgi:ubiquinone biosynthesis protein UbiJ
VSEATLRRILAGEPWARERLAEFAGRSFIVRVGPLVHGFRIGQDGIPETLPAPPSAADLTLTLSPLAVPPLLAAPDRWNEFVTEAGDTAFATTLRELAATLPWFVERILARAFGPIAGQRLADAGRRMLALPEYVTTKLATSLGSYARDEAGVLAGPADAERLAEDERVLAARAEALETRIAALER